MYRLVIVESPAKCQKIQGFLGAGWRVIATMGHIRALPPDLRAIGLDSDFEAKYEWLGSKAKAIQQLKEAARKAADIYLASDDDREGEFISYSVCQLLKLEPSTTPRVVFHEITEKAIQYAMANPRSLDMNRVHAQQSRAILDLMVGFTISSLLWKNVPHALSAGRCQTPALRLVIEREDHIRTFQSSSSWKLSTSWAADKVSYDAVMEDELEDEESVMNYMEQVNKQIKGTILEKIIKPWTESPPPPLITSTLQQQTSALFGMNPKNTMMVAQRLYEAGHITYMRTDKAVLSEEAIKEGQNWIMEQYGEEYVAKKDSTKKDSAKKDSAKKDSAKKDSAKKEPVEQVAAQEAHEAIRPTHMEISQIEGEPHEQRIYQLIWRRAIQSLMSAAKGETCIIRTQIKENTDFVWRSQWNHTTFPGWKRAGHVADLEEKEEEKEQRWENVQHLYVGAEVQWSQMAAQPKETKAQGRYTEATLIRELESHGIGRPSTFATLLAAIQERNYVEVCDLPPKEVRIKEYFVRPTEWPPRTTEQNKKVGGEKKKLVPTELGYSVLRYLRTHFDDLFSYPFTAQMEHRLDRIAEGAEHEKQILRDTWASYQERYHSLRSTKSESAKAKDFGEGLKAVQTKKGPLLLIEGTETQFLGWPKGVAWEDLTEERARAFCKEEQEKKKGEIVGSWRDQPIYKKTGKFGDYLQCGDLSIPYQVEEEAATIARLEAKSQAGPIKQFKEYAIRTGQYGPYIMKTSLKKPQFVSLPNGVNPATLTEKEVEAIYKLGMESKKKWKKK